VRREAHETTPIFAEAWHSDWSFLESSPAGTLLYGKVIPPVGGDTLFADQYAAYDALSEGMKIKIAHLKGIHSARRSYSPGGVYGERDKGPVFGKGDGDAAASGGANPFRNRPSRPVCQFGLHHWHRWNE
jgi:taurine dioxygenase